MLHSKQHVFISYSRNDKTFTESLVIDLQKSDIPVWIDIQGLIPGTQNWEQTIRNAIANAYAVVLVASPHSQQSVYVQGELNLAGVNNCPIYPVWAEGNEWINCVPLSMGNYQYIDCRSEQYSTGVKQITKTLKEIYDIPESLVTISLPTHETIGLNTSLFQNLKEMLDYLWIHHVGDWYDAFTYGNNWVLANVQTKQIAVPWDWISNPDSSRYSMYQIDAKWAEQSLDKFNIGPNATWAVWEASRIRSGAILTNDGTIQERILSTYGIRELNLMRKQKKLKLVSAKNANPSLYRYTPIIALNGTQLHRVAFVET